MYNSAIMWQDEKKRDAILKENYFDARNVWLRKQMNEIFGVGCWHHATIVTTTKPIWNFKYASEMFVTVAYRVETHLQYFEDVH